MLPPKQFRSAERYLGKVVPKELATCRDIKMTKSWEEQVKIKEYLAWKVAGQKLGASQDFLLSYLH